MDNTDFKYIKLISRRKRQSRFISIISIALCIAGLVLTGSLYMSVLNSYQQHITKNFGDYTGIISGNLFGVALKNNPDIIHVGEVSRIGTVGYFKDSIYNGLITIGTLDQKAIELSGLTVESGRLPVTESEIVLDNITAEKLKLNIKLGDFVTLDIFEISDSFSSINVQVVGFINNYTIFQSHLDENGINQLPSVIIGKSDLYTESIFMITTKNDDTSIFEYYEEIFGTEYSINQKFNEATMVSLLKNETGAVVITFFTLMVFSAFLLLHLFHYFSRIELRETINQFKLIGANGVFILKFCIMDALLLYVFALPFGIIIGVILGYFISFSTIDRIIYFFEFRPSVLVVIVTSVFTLLQIIISRSIFAFSTSFKKPAVREHTNTLILSRIRLFGFKRHIFIRWSFKHVINHLKQYIVMMLCLTIFMFFFIYAANISNYIEQILKTDYTEDYCVADLSDGATYAWISIPVTTFYGFDNYYIEEIKKCEEVLEVNEIPFFPVFIREDKYNELLMSRYPVQNVLDTFLSEADFQIEADIFGFTEQDAFFKTNLYGVSQNLWDKISSQQILSGSIYPDRLSSGKHVIVVTSNPQLCPYSVGDTINLLQYLRYDPENFDEYYSDVFDISVVIDSVVVLKDSSLTKWLSSRTFSLVWDQESFSQVGLPVRSNYITINLKDSSQFERTEEILNQMKYTYKNPENYGRFQGFVVTSNREELAEQQALANSAYLLIVLLAVILIGFVLIILINIARRRYYTERRVWGTLRAIGVQKKHAYVQYGCEVVFLLLCSSFISVKILELYFRSFNNTWIMDYSILTIVIICITVFVMCMITAISPIRLLFSKPIAQQISSIE